MILLFNKLFGNYTNKLIISNRSWWDFCIDTWDFDKEAYNYSLDGKSEETQKYLKMLMKNEIPYNYSGCCICNDWDGFLKVILNCIISHKAPYSPLFCDVENNYFFYFHHTGSIGIYYKQENNAINHILAIGYRDYIIES